MKIYPLDQNLSKWVRSGNKIVFETRFGKTHWKDFTKEDLEQIENERLLTKQNFVKDTKKTYGIVCRACCKPNCTLLIT